MFGYFVFLITFVKTASVVEALSAEDVSRAFVLDAVIVAHLKNLLKEASNGTHNQQPSNSDVHSHYVNKFIGEHEQLFGNAEALNTTERKGVEAASDPVKSLILTRRLSKDWSQLLRMSNTAPHHTSWRRVKSEVLKAEKDLAVLLEEEDLTSQTNAFVRIVQMYKLEPSELTELGHQRHRSFFSTNLKTVDVAFIGGTAFDERLYGTAVDLLSTVKQLAENSSETTEDMTTSKRSELLPHLNHLIHLASNLHDLRLTSESYKQQPGMFPRLLSQVPVSVQKERKELLPDPITFRRNLPASKKHTEEDNIRFAQICRGQTFMSDAESARLKCRLDSRGSPYLLLMPAMVEEHSLNPKIVTFYKVLSHKQINKITDTARPMLEQAQIKSSDDIGPDESFKVRSSYTAWVREERLPMLKKLRMKIEALTGMSADENTNAAEILQVNLYAAGGYYLPHLDAFSLLSEQQDNVDVPAEFYGGDRIGTFMFYMNDVEAGGHTAFPRIGVGVKPSAGSAVFWSNLLPDGFEDTRTMHGACPVLKGIKWVNCRCTM
ncbi:prolyl 4-hydroxylase subunit alpha-2-like isoform X2 [Macrobrachium rosenbergii]|uniref:prolyl 4-hydroxylase subunit alpha-2-like isoform X2 n=1 Tax=Macrobrachium rosenbergii TaxID=79674 RepID=UPI0034D516A9